jgi:hypothetical protein
MPLIRNTVPSLITGLQEQIAELIRYSLVSRSVATGTQKSGRLKT